MPARLGGSPPIAAGMYDLQAVSRYVGVSTSDILSAIKARRMTATRIGRQWYVEMKAIRRWMVLQTWKAQGIWSARAMQLAKQYERYLKKWGSRDIDDANKAMSDKGLGKSDNSSELI